MGGPGSGEWDRWNVKTTVEECISIDVKQLARERALRFGTWGSVNWGNGDVMSVALQTVLGPAGDRVLQVSYVWQDSEEGDPEDIVIPIRLQTTQPHLGGVRWWFTCPLIVDGVACERRVGRLHLPPGDRYFGCQICHDLTYRSCQQSHQLERLLDDGGHERWMARLDRKNAKLDRGLAGGSRPARTMRS